MTENNIKGPFIKKINDSNKYFYKLSKPKSDSKIKKNIKIII